MCFRFIDLGFSFLWFLNSFVLEGYCNYLLKISENVEYGLIRIKRFMFVNLNGSGFLIISEKV